LKDIVYACNDDYVEQTIISMVSLLKHNAYPIKFWIISDGISEENRRLILEKTTGFEMPVEFVEIDSVLGGVSISDGDRHPLTVYAKLFLENVISSDKVLYLDSDTVIDGDLSDLWERDMTDELVAGVQMPYSVKQKARMNISSGSPYLCDGVVLLNLRYWRERKIGDRCKEYIVKEQGNPPMLSEGTLNYVCQNYIGVLPPDYNLMPSMIWYTGKQIRQLFKTDVYYQEDELQVARKRPVVVHYMNELYNRPWLVPCDHPYKQLYCGERQALFGTLPFREQPLNRHTRMTRGLNATLPFVVFAGLYHIKHKDI